MKEKREILIHKFRETSWYWYEEPFIPYSIEEEKEYEAVLIPKEWSYEQTSKYVELRRMIENG